MVTATIAEPFARAIKASSSAAAAVGLLPVSSVLLSSARTSASTRLASAAVTGLEPPGDCGG